MSPIRTSTSVITNTALESIQVADVMTFVTAGAAFSPVLVLTGTGTVLWTFPDGSTSASLTPSVNWGTAASREVTLTVTPWSVLQRINLGYDAGDGGSQAIELVAACDVTSIEGLDLVRPTLKQLCVSQNKRLTSIDLRDMVMLDTFEAYQTSALAYVTLGDNRALRRLCLEQCAIEYMDLSQCPALEDLRGAVNQVNGIFFGATGKHVWHICVRENTNLNSPMPPLAQFPLLEDAWWWSTPQSGLFDASTTRTDSVLSTIALDGCDYTSVDFRGRFLAGQGIGVISIQNNQLTSINITGCVRIARLLIAGNNLPEAQVDAVLAQLVAGIVDNGILDISGTNMAVPSETGLANAIALRVRGWTVDTSAPAPALESIAITPAASSVNAGRTLQMTAMGTYDDASTVDLTATATWASSDETHATVATGGLVTGVTESTAGEITITATVGAIDGTTTLTIDELLAPAVLESIAVTPADGSVAMERTIQFTATGTYDDASTDDITGDVVWTSSDETHATITAGGLASGIAESTAGEVTITATLDAIEGTTTLTVGPVTANASIVFTTEGTTCSPRVVVTNNATVTWHWSDETISTGAVPAAKNFVTAAHREHWMEVSVDSDLTGFGGGGDTKIGTVESGLAGYVNLADITLFETSDLTYVNLGEVSHVTNPALSEIYLAYTAISEATLDQMLIDFAAVWLQNTALPQTLYIRNRVTAASLAARESLAAYGWSINLQ